MPLLVRAVVAWLAAAGAVAWRHLGVRAGETAVPSWVAIVGAGCVVACAVHGRRTAAALSTIALASLLLADAAWRAQADCVAFLADARTPLLLRVDDVVHDTTRYVRGVAATDDALGRLCRVDVGAGIARRSGDARRRDARRRVDADAGESAPDRPTSVGASSIPAGAWAIARTESRIAAGRTLRLDGVTITPTGSVDGIAGWRGRTGHVIDTLFRARAAVVRALLVADRSGIDPAVRDAFAAAGLAHLLSISGLHVALIAGAVRTLLRALRRSPRAADAGAFLGVAAYVVVLGLPAPALRAATMLAVLALARHIGRPVHPWTALALGVLVPALDPRVVAELGWQLSSAGMAALVAARAILRRVRTPPRFVGERDPSWRRALRRVRGWRAGLLRELLVTTLATLITAPLIAWSFGQLSLVAPLANLLASPLVSLLQPMLFLTLVVALLPGAMPLAAYIADGSRVPLALLSRVAETASDLPGAAMYVAPSLASALLCSIAMGAFVVATARRRSGPPLLVVAASLTAAVWLPVALPASGSFELHVLDVGQGDALALRTPRGRWILVDAGRAWRGGDAGRRTVVPWVKRRGGRVALFVLTHPDADHAGGAASVVRALRPAELWDPGFVHGSGIYADLLTATRTWNVPWRRVRAGARVELDGVEVRVLGPDSAWTAQQRSGNDASTVLMVRHGAVSFLLTGDAESAQEAELLRVHGAALRATVLKVGHHGSRTSTTPPFLGAVAPQLALVSVGEGNRYGHPHPDIETALREAGAAVVRTDRDGAIIVRSDGRRLTVETRGGRFVLDAGAIFPP